MKLFLTNKDQNKLLEVFNSLEEGEYTIDIRKTRHTRTSQQQAAIELYCSMVADEFNNAGITRSKLVSLFKKESPWCQESVKELVWRELQELQGFGRKTSSLTTEKVTKVYEWCNLFTAKFGISVPFPSKEGLERN